MACSVRLTAEQPNEETTILTSRDNEPSVEQNATLKDEGGMRI